MANRDRPELGEELTNSFCRTDPEIARHFARTTFTSDNRADLKKVKADTLILQTRDDIIASEEVGEFVVHVADPGGGEGPGQVGGQPRGPGAARASPWGAGQPYALGGHLGPVQHLPVYRERAGLVAVRVLDAAGGAGAEEGEDVAAYGQWGVGAAAVDAAGQRCAVGLEAGLQEAHLVREFTEPAADALLAAAAGRTAGLAVEERPAARADGAVTHGGPRCCGGPHAVRGRGWRGPAGVRGWSVLRGRRRRVRSRGGGPGACQTRR